MAAHSHIRLSAAALGMCVLLAGLNLWVIPSYTGDDAFIHFTYIRNLVGHHVFAYNTNTPTYGTSSLLYDLAGTIVCAVTGEIPTTMRIFGGLLLALAAVLFSRFLLMRTSLGEFECLGGLALFLGNAVLFRWFLTGMEIGAILSISVALLLWWNPGNYPVRSSILVLLAFLVRQEFLLLPVAYVAVEVVQSYPRVRIAPRFVVLVTLMLGAAFAVTRLYFGTFFPLTALKAESLLDGESAGRFSTILGGMYPDMIVLLLLLAVGKRISLKWVRSLVPPEQALIVFAVGVLAVYFLAGTNMISRYLLVVHLPIVLFVIRSLEAGPRRAWKLLAPVGVLLVQTILFVNLHLSPVRSFVSGFQRTFGTIGNMLVPQDPEDRDSIMLSDVGMVGYYSGRPIVDLVGLTSLHVKDAGTNDEAVLARLYRPRYSVVKSPRPEIGEYIEGLKRKSGCVRGAQVLCHDTIGPLGVLSVPGQSMDVYLLKLQY